MNTIYSYVDESGQHTAGKYFVVTVIVAENLVDELSNTCLEFEKRSGKGKTKWGRSKHSARMDYLKYILNNELFTHRIYYGIYRDTTRYHDATITAISKSLNFFKPEGKHTNVVFVDALSRTKARAYQKNIKSHGLYVKKVVGIQKDENSALIRLADTVSGFIGDIEQGHAKSKSLIPIHHKALRSGHFIDVENYK